MFTTEAVSPSARGFPRSSYISHQPHDSTEMSLPTGWEWEAGWIGSIGFARLPLVLLRFEGDFFSSHPLIHL